MRGLPLGFSVVIGLCSALGRSTLPNCARSAILAGPRQDPASSQELSGQLERMCSIRTKVMETLLIPAVSGKQDEFGGR
jgi:hypothetical protein